MSQLAINFEGRLTKPYYNTTNLKGEDLANEKENACYQEERILRLFEITKKGTPSEIMKKYEWFWPPVPITSIRRAITNLTKERKLIKSDEMRVGLYGKPEHVWQIVA